MKQYIIFVVATFTLSVNITFSQPTYYVLDSLLHELNLDRVYTTTVKIINTKDHKDTNTICHKLGHVVKVGLVDYIHLINNRENHISEAVIEDSIGVYIRNIYELSPISLNCLRCKCIIEISAVRTKDCKIANIKQP